MFEEPFWKIGSRGRSSSRVQLASNCFKLIPMFSDYGPHPKCSNSNSFHLMNHTFFKALPFLNASSVIYAMSDEQDMRKMGGLASLLPFIGSKILLLTNKII